MRNNRIELFLDTDPGPAMTLEVWISFRRPELTLDGVAEDNVYPECVY